MREPVKYDSNLHGKSAVESMFDTIARRYDFLNHFLSCGIDRHWRSRAVRIISETRIHSEILDVATGTGDLAIALMKLNPVKITGIDISEKMLGIGRDKIQKLGLKKKIELIKGNSENIVFDDNTFDVVTVAFGVRNFSDPLKGLSEMRRVTRNGGLVLILEFSKPDSFPLRPVYNFYFRRALPVIGRLFSKNREAYRYLPESVMKFPDNEKFIEMMVMAGLKDVKNIKLTGGIVTIYTGVKLSVQ